MTRWTKRRAGTRSGKKVDEHSITTANRTQSGNVTQPTADHYNISQLVKEMEIETKFIQTVNFVKTDNHY
jgi:hypothetical protein